jgi:hypothetical protein
MASEEVVVDALSRVSLSFRRQDHRRYRAEEKADGTIVLTPLASVHAMKIQPLGDIDWMDEFRKVTE